MDKFVELVRSHPIKIYILMCLLPAHLVLWPLLAFGVNQASLQPLKLLFSFLPTGSALVITYAGWGEEAVRDLWKRTFLKEGRIKGYTISLVSFVLIGAIALLARYYWDGYFPPENEYPPFVQILIAAPFLLLFPGFVEEYGWRGFMQDRLQTKHSVFVASLLVGLVWGTWHTMDFLMGNWPYSLGNVIAFYAYITGVSVVIGGLYYYFNRSIFVAMIAHFSANLVNFFVPVWNLDVGYTTPIIYISLVWVCALGVLFVKRQGNQ